jgi:DNA recombination protein RmuC
MLYELIFLIIGLLLGATMAAIYYRFRKSGQVEILEARLQTLTENLRDSQRNGEDKQHDILELNRQLSARDADLKHIQEKLNEQKAEVEKIQEKFKIEFKNLANEILEEKTKKFTEHNSSRLNEILNPLSQKIKEFEKKVEETYEKETEQRISLREEVKKLTELNLEVSKETSNLTRALKGESKTQGSWGEVILESILERSGLVKNREYFVQPSFSTESGRRLQPDVVVQYPGQRSVVIDSKVSLTAYEKYASAEDESKRAAYLKDHLNSIRNHIKELADKNYPDIYQLQALDFVMMFLPVEPAYHLAIQEEPEIWNAAYDQRILLISPTNLIAALKMVESMWRQEYQNRNVLEIAKQSGALYDKFEGLINDLRDLGKRLESAQSHYQNSMNKLVEGRGSLVSRVENIKKLGAKTKKSLPDDLLEKTKGLEE